MGNTQSHDRHNEASKKHHYHIHRHRLSQTSTAVPTPSTSHIDVNDYGATVTTDRNGRSIFPHDQSGLSLKREADLEELALQRTTTNMILTEEQEHVEFSRSGSQNIPMTISRAPSGIEVSFVEDVGVDAPLQRVDTGAEPVTLTWREPGKRVAVTGTFVNWAHNVVLERDNDGFLSTVIYLRPGTHRIDFIVDGEAKVSNAYPCATDEAGTLFNYIEVHDNTAVIDKEPKQQLENSNDDDMPLGPLNYNKVIPEIYQKPEDANKILGAELVSTPPVLPPQLETAIVNLMTKEKEDSSVLPVPNHVVLNHLATTTIKHNMLSVATTCRYSRKFVTQILYAPL